MDVEGEEMKWGLLAGKLKIWQTRLQTYTAMVNFFMLFYIFIQDNEWLTWYWWLVFMVVTISVVLFIDVKYIMPNALGYQWTKNKSFNRLEQKVDRLLEEMQK